MKKLALILFLFLAGCAQAPQPGSYYIIPADGTITPDYTFCDGADCWYVAYLVPTNVSTHTPTPTNTPAVEPTETQEIILTPTPFPTLPPLKSCKLRNGPSNYNIRAKPGPTDATNPAIGSWTAGDDGEFNGFAVDGTRTYWWAHWANNAGWSAVGRYLDTIQMIDWFVYGLPESELCQDVIGWPAPNGIPVEPPAPFAEAPTVLYGQHYIVGASDGALVDAPNMGSAKDTTHSSMALYAKGRNPAIVTIFRSLHNCHGTVDGPLVSERLNPSAYYDCLNPYLQPGYDYYEYINEWAHWEGRPQWEIEMLTLFAAHGRCALFLSEGPGGPDYPDWPRQVEVMRWIDDNPCGRWPDGRLKYHGLAYHQPLLWDQCSGAYASSYMCNLHIARRMPLVNDVLYANTGYRFEDFKGPIYCTECGLEDYTIPNLGFTCEQVRHALTITTAWAKANAPYIDGFLVWNFGGAGGINNINDGLWVNLTACAPLA